MAACTGMGRHPLFTVEHEELRVSVRRFVDRELRPHVDEWEEAGRFPDEVFRRAGELGFLGLHYPTRWGGAGGDLAAELVFVEELGKAGCGALAMALSVQTDMATPALERFGTDDQKERYLRPAIAGTKIAAIAITEPDAGSDVAAISTRADRDGDRWRITGRKLFITNGARADFLTLVAKTDPDAGHHGISLFLVDTDTAGVTVSRTLRKLGMWSSDTAEIALDDVEVPHANLIGSEPGRGFAQLMVQLQYERLAGAAASVGGADAALARTVEYARERRAFGQPIGRHQVIAHRLADAATELRGGAEPAVHDGVAGPGGRVPGGGDLDDEEVLRPGPEPGRRQLRAGVRRRRLPARGADLARLPRCPAGAHRRRNRRDHERSHRQAPGRRRRPCASRPLTAVERGPGSAHAK